VSGETEEHVSGWTVDTLRAHLDIRIGDLRREIDALDRLSEARSRAQDEKVELAMAAADKATAKQEVDTNHRLSLLNELRSDVATKQALDALAERLSDLKERLDRIEGATSGVRESGGDPAARRAEDAARRSQAIAMASVAVAVLAVVVTVVIAVAVAGR
jgi:hypothetical protein